MYDSHEISIHASNIQHDILRDIRGLAIRLCRQHSSLASFQFPGNEMAESRLRDRSTKPPDRRESLRTYSGEAHLRETLSQIKAFA